MEQRELASIFERKAEKFYAEALSESPVVAVSKNILLCGNFLMCGKNEWNLLIVLLAAMFFLFLEFARCLGI